MTVPRLPDDVSEIEVLKAMIGGCRLGHRPSIESARRVLRRRVYSMTTHELASQLEALLPELEQERCDECPPGGCGGARPRDGL